MLCALALAGALAAGPVAPAQAAPFSVGTPVVSSIDIPPFSPPEGSFHPITVTAAPSPHKAGTPATVRFAVPQLARYHYLYSYRYLAVDWRNLRTGKTGTVFLRYARTEPYATGYPMSLPTSALATTGTGPIAATVRILREQYQRPPDQVQIIPGLNVVVVD